IITLMYHYISGLGASLYQWVGSIITSMGRECHYINGLGGSIHQWVGSIITSMGR
ncbi:hypothetical protein ACJMK2_024259, partial [Sinanodonta woodiana]